ncbi:MAG: GNAT family N-acetyltransferase [Clostridia bacterium]|nr:GNAT family N-acetyltransferase [Clostridia bacterium]
MKIRNAVLCDLDAVMKIVESARKYFAENGIPQWQWGYPSESDFETDIRLKRLYVAEENDRILGLFCYDNGGDENYEEIFDGSFSSDAPYAAIHRVAVDEDAKGKGVAGEMVAHAVSLARSEGFMYMRGDTHRKNISMQRMLEKNGFEKRGIIYIDRIKTPENERFAFERRLI